MDTLYYSESKLVKALWQAAHAFRFPIALWRLPNSNTQQLIIEFSGSVNRTEVDLRVLPAGFVFSPFHNPDGKQSLFIKADVQYQFEMGQSSTSLQKNGKRVMLQGAEKFWQTVDQYLSDSTIHASAFSEGIEETQAWGANQQTFEALVARGVKTIQEGEMLKVVLSRRKQISLPGGVDIIDTFNRLCKAYSSAFVSLVSVPEVGTWMGASPEILVSVDANQQFRTMALAGTQPFLPGMEVVQASWTQKEIEEQALVSRYIVNCFKHIRLREFEEDGPKTVVAGNLLHLRTDFVADMEGTGFPDLGTTMLHLLHPTSAVCGMPKKQAEAFILRYEGYDRAFFSGFLGPVNMQQESHLFVNLRCMQWGKEKAWLYAGAGITANSIPEKEWRETELKCQTMAEVLTAAVV